MQVDRTAGGQCATGEERGTEGDWAGVTVVSGAPVVNVPMVDEANKATANINVLLNVAANQSVAVGYENTSTSNQDVSLTRLTVSEVWGPE